MSNRTKCWWFFLVTLCCSVGLLEAVRQIEDFEFEDTDQGMNMIRGTAVYSDDEDFLADEAGSTPDQDFEIEGSGTTTVVSPTRGPIVEDYPRFFRVVITFPNLRYVAAFNNRTSPEFIRQSEIIVNDLLDLLKEIQGRKKATVLQYGINQRGQTVVSLDLGYEGYAFGEDLQNILEIAVQMRKIGTSVVSPDEFSFRPLVDEVQCPIYVGRAPEYLPRNGTNFAYLLINNLFPCDGTVVSWEYYRLISQGSAFVGVWRQISGSELALIRKTELPSGPIGINIVRLETPIDVERGDFIGIFYPRSTPNNVIAQATAADDLVSPTELYQTYYAQFFENNVQENGNLDLETVRYIPINATFALRAIMKYETIAGEAYTCQPEEFACGDLFCIPAEYRCDGQDDCSNGLDEQNCFNATETCIEGRFRCSDGNCISKTLMCDGKRDCSDGGDERCFLCTEAEFTCTSGECLPQSQRCDKEVQCRDGSDENGCGVTCREDEFTCQNGQCIPIDRLCDAQPDCSDNSDEDRDICLPIIPTYPPACKVNFFRCTAGLCVESSKRCDGLFDCPDRSDELECDQRACTESEFRCGNGVCIDSRLECDTINDCDDGSDESQCALTCGPSEFTCNNGECIDLRRRCDYNPDCRDRSDELGCPLTCGPSQFTCNDGECIDLRRRCDYYPDCRDGSDELGCPCREEEFRCGDGRCLAQSLVCNRQVDCSDGLDERNCERCRRNEFECGDGNCIDRRYRCDRSPQCPDRSDEFNCTCNSAEFRCGNGQCVPQQVACDGRWDCFDGTDETDCAPACREDQFTCANGDCVDRRRTCDGRADCTDRSDEDNCPPIRRCRENQFECDSGHCLAMNRRCDGYRDCPFGSDEVGCPTCSPAEFTCGNGQCISSGQRCDRRADCLDGSDERNCPCPSGDFTCVSDGRCLPPGYRCNGNPDCRDGSDEQDCKVSCTETEFTCQSGQCVPLAARCNGRLECQDRSDELECVIACRPEEFRCSDGQCVALSSRCDRRYDCRDRSDELDCACRQSEFTCTDGQCVPESAQCDRKYDCRDGSDERNCDLGYSVSVSPQQMRKRTGTSASFVCLVTGSPPPAIVWSRRTGGAMPSKAVDANGRLTIIDLRLEDAGDYVCQVITPTRTFEAVARLEVDYIGPPTVAPDPDGPCGREEATCSNGQCIPRDYLCDGESDCTDGSDEFNCNIALPCEPNEFRCNNGRCALKIWRCDGDDDCSDNSDESNCPTRVPGAPCQSDEFHCRSNNQCIPSAYQCDGELDCLDRSDEISCSPPAVVVPPVSETIVEVNGTFIIRCEAIGVPTPLIVWRLNWGNIPSGDRVSVISEEGRGVLTVKFATLEDAGAYTCEAINNRGSIFAIPDAHIFVRRTLGVCQFPRFNAEANSPDQCVRCFCYGQTQTCYSSNLQISQITLGNQVTIVRRPTLEPTESRFVQYVPSSREFEVRDFNRVLGSGSYYWLLPYQYISKKLSSYGGELAYRAYYEVETFDVPTSDPDVIISGNGITLSHKSSSSFRPRVATTVTVPLVESAWERSQDSPRDGPISEYASREDLMQVLENVTSILIRATYDNRQSLVRLGGVLLTTGVPQATGLGRAVRVEECSCPTGYAGLSCEECASGFYRVDRGRYGRECVACSCNGFSNDCNPITGFCRNCRDNTAGPYCDECAAGYTGDPKTGACQPCPCPLTSPDNQFSRTCSLDRNGEIICTACPEGYTGRRCERCASGYRGNPLTPGDRCIRAGDYVCDERGSLTTLPDRLTQQCGCKANVEGQYCDRCIPNTFYLSGDYQLGCYNCFCMGVTQTCQSTTWNRAQISLPFTQSTSEVVLTDSMQLKPVSQGLNIDRQTRELVFRDFNRIDKSVQYWSLPQQFLGDRVTSYGGFLRFTIRYQAGRNRSPATQSDQIVEIGGNDITLVHRVSRPIPEENRPVSFSIPFTESQWFRMDGEQATREHLLMALADLEFILIRAAYTVDTTESAISGISLDIAENRETGQERAHQVEQCACPRGYTGLSCEDCDAGFTRTGGGLYLGLCEPCQCNGHSSECDPETGVCRSCRHNTEGSHCERCVRGYYGEATRGSVLDCQKCPCPLTDSPNQFSPECILEADGQVTCTSCPIGHTGRRCERCVGGYQGNPNQLGDYCKLVNVTCDCDERGIVANTLCDPNTQQCQCKANVQGRRCSTCKEGFFNLNRENEVGCLKCFCSGVSTRCSSSNYYRDEIVPMFNADGSHNFQLTNSRLTQTITDGFIINAERNEITFNSFRGIQREQESLFFSLPPKFRGDKVSSYGGYLRFSLFYTRSFDTGQVFPDKDVEIITKQAKRLFYIHPAARRPRETVEYNILLTENSFKNQEDGQYPTREAFLSALADIDAIIIRASYHTAMDTVTLRDLRLETAIPSVTALKAAPEVEICVCPEGYTGLSCQSCAAGYLRVEDTGSDREQCVRCRCNGHSTSCNSQTGVCLDCRDNTVGDRCERCAPGYYGDPTAGTPNDCRVCPCPLTIPTNQFSATCVLDRDNRVTCDKCPPGYTGRDCGQCAPDYQGNPREPGGRCERVSVGDPRVSVTPVSLSEPLGATATIQCTPSGRAPFNVIWSRIDGRPLPRRATQEPGPNYSLVITNLEYDDSARYICQVTNAAGSVRDYATLIVERPDPTLKVKIMDPTTVEARPGQTARFICVAVQFSSSANYVLSWTKERGTLPPKAIDENGVLVIPDLQDSDLGTYTCTGSDPATLDRATASITFGDMQEPPTVRIEPRYLQVSEGDPAQFQCLAEGNPRPSVSWTKGKDGPLPDHIFTDETGVFRIPSVTKQDEADYHCTATNSQGSASVRTIIYVQRKSRVEVLTRRADITAEVGQREQLVCYVQGGDGVTLVWSRDGGLPPGATQENGVLTLTDIQQSFTGVYTCTGTVATGVVGRATARITVIGEQWVAPTVRIEPDRLTVSAGTTGSLRCLVTGQPQPTITWSRASGQLSSNHQINGQFLRILQATLDDRGVYVCSASNVAGSAQSSAFVEIERREPPIVELYPEIQQVQPAGSSAIFQCRVVGGVPEPVVTWSRASGREFTNRTQIKPDMGTIMFSDLTAAEQGEYLCTATNDAGTITATAILKVEGPPTIEITPGTHITTTVGSRVNIECVAVGDPTPSVVWRSSQRRRSDVLPEADSDPGTARLLFESIQKNDEGQYICTATNLRGRSEDTVDVVVQEQQTDSRPSVSVAGSEYRSLTSGQSAELTCTSQGLSNPRYRWRRPGNLPLPLGHRVRGGVLYIPQIEPDYAGEYICSVSTDTTSTEFVASTHIIVGVVPQLTVSPARVTVNPGQPVQLRCQASGQGPFNIEWTKLDGQLSTQARERDGVLEIRQATRADAGRYRCVATNAAGPAEGFADVTVLSPPSVTVLTKQVEVEAGDTVEIKCNSQGDPAPVVRWEKEVGELPPQHQTRNGVLKIYNAQPEDTGRYFCKASSSAGTAVDYTFLRVTSLRVPGPAVYRAQVGERVTLDCTSSGNEQPIVTWTKVGDLMPESAIFGSQQLILPAVSKEDAGIYQCQARNLAGSIQTKVELQVEDSLDFPSPDEEYVVAALGTPAQLRCNSQGSPAQRISWTKEGQSLSSLHEVNYTTGELYIPKVKEEDGGHYICETPNQRHPVVLIVEALVPYFQQNPVSYMTFLPLNDAYLELDIRLSFRPEATDGLILYNGQYDNSEAGDFVCFGLQGRYPEFRFDVGSGTATIRGAQPLELNKWHTVHLKRSRKNGTLLVNDDEAYYGESTGNFEGLDLAQPMYLGNVPSVSGIPPSARFASGFVGGISEIKIKGVDLNLGQENLAMVSVSKYPVCSDGPCLNNGSCRPQNSRYGFTCDCPQGFTGFRCEAEGKRCYKDACGSQGKCYNWPAPAVSGFSCICPVGYTGEGCLQRLQFVEPSFNKTSFLSYPKISTGLLSVSVKMLFKPQSLDDGIILYNAQRQDGRQDFIAVIIKDQHLEFRFDTGSGPAILRSSKPLTVNSWTRVLAERNSRDGVLTVNDDQPVYGNASGDKVGLNLARPLYLGGVDPHESLSTNVGASTGFVGCVAELNVGVKSIHLFEDAVDSLNIQDCNDRKLCDRRPCLNNARCVDVSSQEYRCICPSQYTGKNCETQVNICTRRKPCQNRGQCVVEGAGYRCACPHPWSGTNCDIKLTLTNSINVAGDSFAEFRKALFPHARRVEKEVINFTISTFSPNGLFFWQGQLPGEQSGKDYLALGLKDGYVEFRFELGSGPATIQSSDPIDDGFPHRVVVQRTGRNGSIKIDKLPPVSGSSSGTLQALNVAGNFYFGGVPDLKRHTDSLYTENFSGCLSDIVIGNRTLDLSRDLLSGLNLKSCPNL